MILLFSRFHFPFEASFHPFKLCLSHFQAVLFFGIALI
ncbi:hypothetical protein EFW57_03506 [Bacillus velezensis]|nr:hypothetical protein HS9_01973 [Bacillus velezensis]RUR96615.1 hypothetical protein EFW57_03506 [Bacillus velezensis]RUS03301.1 hypothetical protein EFW58_03749 [Bacillus velezensis]